MDIEIIPKTKAAIPAIMANRIATATAIAVPSAAPKASATPPTSAGSDPRSLPAVSKKKTAMHPNGIVNPENSLATIFLFLFFLNYSRFFNSLFSLIISSSRFSIVFPPYLFLIIYELEIMSN